VKGIIKIRRLLLCLLVIVLTGEANAQTSKPTWIWYPGDFEIWLSNEVQVKRTNRNALQPPWWRTYTHNSNVSFATQVDLKEEEEITIASEGKYNVIIDGKYWQGDIHKILIPPGKHTIMMQVYNVITPPSIFVSGKTIASDTSWYSNTIRGSSPGQINNLWKVKADAWTFNNQEQAPSKFKLQTKEEPPVNIERKPGSVLVDFGKETFGFVRLNELKGSGTIDLYYGESPEEALSIDSCETLDHLVIKDTSTSVFVVNHSRAFRYVNIHYSGNIMFKDVDMLYEYLPLTYRGSFKCSDEELNKIWDISAYTLHLNTREFFLDGIKRDRWIWSGDANQSYLMNYYLFFDDPVVKRTVLALRGGDPVETHINTILDYSFYWFMSIYDYYLYSGDKEFIRNIYPRMVTLMDFCLKRRNKNNMVEGLTGDWVFLDWAPVSKKGELSAIQILFCRSLESIALCASLMNDTKKSIEYSALAKELKGKIMSVFWDKNQKAFLHNRMNGQTGKEITRYANMFALMFNYLDSAKTESVKTNVLMNDHVLKITTPYMRFYELEALCAIGQQDYVRKEIKDYWGGMLKEGATSFWELYDPNEKGTNKYAMYGRPFGKSLCHAWGASPIYLLGKYFLGVKPLKPGYAEYLVEPNLGGLEWIEGKVPAPRGDIYVAMDKKQITVSGVTGIGTLRFKSKKKPSSNDGNINKINGDTYELKIEPGKKYVVSYFN